MNYCLKPGYRERADPVASTPHADELDSQPDNYRIADLVARACGSSRVIDLGPAQGLKAKRWLTLPVIGVDVYPHQGAVIEVVAHDLDSDAPIPVDAAGATVVASDVIEHLRRPDLFLDQVVALDADALVISTPERVGMYGYDHDGPPRNPEHCREWTSAEFEAFLREHGFDPIMLRARSAQGRPDLNTTVAIVAS